MISNGVLSGNCHNCTQWGRLWISYPRTTFYLLTTYEQAHYISPHELFASSMAGKSAWKSQKRRGPSLDINPAQATHL